LSYGRLAPRGRAGV